jgi:quercetin dioxygenase-like cupin family protein
MGSGGPGRAYAPRQWAQSGIPARSFGLSQRSASGCVFPRTAAKIAAIKTSEETMRRNILSISLVVAAGVIATAASAQTSTSPTGPAFSQRFFTTALANDPSRDVQMQMQLHLPNRAGNGFHSHNGDQWEVVLDGEITFTVKGQEPRVLKAGEYVYIPRGTIHRNENKSAAPTRTIELLIKDKDKPQNIPAPAN